jgi:hypothetical protein
LINGVRLSIKDSGPLNIQPRLNVELDVGLLPADADVRHEGTKLTVGQVAAINEFGNTAANIPSRPAFRAWAAMHGTKFRAQMGQAIADMVRTQKFNPGPFERLAMAAQRSLKATIASGQIMPKNAPRTLAKKAPEIRPLIETGQLLRAIGARVRSKRGLLSWNFTTGGGKK